jgi:hypothetical protein
VVELAEDSVTAMEKSWLFLEVGDLGSTSWVGWGVQTFVVVRCGNRECASN